MKNLLLAAALFMFALAGCKKESTGTNNSSLIVGKWNMNKADVVTYKNGEKLTELSMNYGAGSFIQFNGDNSYHSYVKSPGEDEFSDETGSYSVDGNVLKITENGTNQPITIKQIDNKKLTLGFTDSDDEGEDNERTEITMHLSR